MTKQEAELAKAKAVSDCLKYTAAALIKCAKAKEENWVTKLRMELILSMGRQQLQNIMSMPAELLTLNVNKTLGIV